MELVADREAFENIEIGQEFTIFTHSRKSRMGAVFVFLSYLMIFVMFTEFLRGKIQAFRDTPIYFAAASEIPAWLFYTMCGLGWTLALVILLYFMWTIVDIWGLQVSAGTKFLFVKNTIVGDHFSGLMGTGSVAMEDILVVKGTPTATYLLSQAHKLRISPVDGIALLIDIIRINAGNAVFET